MINTTSEESSEHSEMNSDDLAFLDDGPRSSEEIQDDLDRLAPCSSRQKNILDKLYEIDEISKRAENLIKFIREDRSDTVIEKKLNRIAKKEPRKRTTSPINEDCDLELKKTKIEQKEN